MSAHTHDEVLASLRADAARATTPTEAFRVAILAVHYARTVDAPVPTAYAGARRCRQFLEEVTGQKLGDDVIDDGLVEADFLPDRAIVNTYGVGFGKWPEDVTRFTVGAVVNPKIMLEQGWVVRESRDAGRFVATYGDLTVELVVHGSGVVRS